MATAAVSAQGEKLYVKKDGAWVKIGEVKSTPEVGESADKLDATHLECEAKAYIKNIPDLSGDLEFTCNAMPVGTAGSNVALVQSLDRNAAYEWRYVMPRLGIQVTWTGEWSYRYGAGAVSTVKDLIITILPKTRPIEAVITGSYTLSYDANGGTGTMAAQTVTAGRSVVPGECTLTNGDKSFAYWSTSADGTGASYDATDSIDIYEDTTLYAIWSE